MSKFDVSQTVAELEGGTVPAWIQEHLRAYRESGGSEGHDFDARPYGGTGIVPSLLLTTTGRLSGERREMPLFYGAAGDGFVVIGSKGGSATQPAWYLNLLAEPRAEVQVRERRIAVRARVAEGDERAALWARMVALYPMYEDYQARTPRRIPVVVLEPVDTAPETP